jgi:predicted permease
MTTLLRRLRAWLSASSEDFQTKEEIRFHIEMETERNLRAGMSAEEAKRRALVAFGGTDLWRERTREARRVGPFEWLTEVTREVLVAVRRLRRRPIRGVGMALALAIGIGVTITAFAAVDAVLLRAFPVERQDELVVVWRSNPDIGSLEIPFRAGEYDAVARGARSFSEVAGMTAWGAQPAAVDLRGEPTVMRHATIVGDFFGVLGTRPTLGRLTTDADDAVGAAPLAILSHEAWLRRFGGDPEIVGTTLVVENVAATIVGVAAAGFEIPPETELWTPARIDLARAATDGSIAELHVVGRLADPGAGVDAVGAEVAAVLTRTLGEDLSFPRSMPMVWPLEDRVVGAVRPMLRAALLAALVLLGAAGANATVFLISEGRTAGELAVRHALGAGRGRLVARLLAEAGLVAALGLAVGIALAWGAIRTLVRLAPPELPRLELIHLDARALGIGVVVAVACTLIASVTGAWVMARLDQRALLASPAHGPSEGLHLRRTVAGLQVGLTVLSAVGAGLMIRTVAALNRIEPGIAASEISVVSLRTPYSWAGVPESYLAALDEVVRDLESRPGIVAARPSLGAPLAQRLEGILFGEDQPEDERADNPFVAIDFVMPGHLAAMGIPLLAGRELTRADNESSAAPVVVIDEVLAAALWPGENPLGKRLLGAPDAPPFTVVGVAAATRYREMLDAHPRAYYPIRRVSAAPIEALLVRAEARDLATIDNLAREAFARADPSVRVLDVRPMASILRGPTLGRRFAAGILTWLAGATLLLSVLGVYAVYTTLVDQRVREMGIRRALGAGRSSIVVLVLGGLLRVASAGVVAGLVAAFGSSRLVASLLYGVAPADPVTVLTVVSGSLAVALFAGLAPALRASSADPAVSLRSD